MTRDFARDRLTWLLYLVAAWFAYLQAAPGLVVPHLRDELGISYSVGGLHVAAFAGGSMLGGLVVAVLERALGRRRVLWGAAAVMAAGTVALTAGQAATATVAAVLVMGVGGGLVLATVQAALADHHRDHQAVALAEENVAASVAYLGVVAAFSLATAVGVGWRAALLVSLVVPVLAWSRTRDVRIRTGEVTATTAAGRLPGPFWVAAGVLVCTTAAEWCVTAWGASFVEESLGVSAGTAVSLMAGYFGGVLVGRVVASRLARRYRTRTLLAAALGLAALGFAVTWPAETPVQALLGLALLGVGLGNLYPLGTALAVAAAPGRAGAASGRVVAFSSLAVLLAPLTVGAVADAASLRAALLVVPGLLVLALAGLVLLPARRREDCLAAG